MRSKDMWFAIVWLGLFALLLELADRAPTIETEA
jgi:hypothetical protein